MKIKYDVSVMLKVACLSHCSNFICHCSHQSTWSICSVL